MAIARALWNQTKKKVDLLQGVKATLATNTKTRDHGNGNNSSAEAVRALCKQGRMKDALNILDVMNPQGILPDSHAYASLLQGCASLKSLPHGKLVHAHIILTGLDLEISLETKLMIMYAQCGSLVDARRVLDEIPKQSVVSFTAMIAAYARHGYGEEALTLFYQMQRADIQPDQFTFASVLPACANLAALEHGKVIHEGIVRSGFQFDIVVSNALVDMYAKCGSIEYACIVFGKMPERSVVSCNAMIAGYAQNGRIDEAKKLFQNMSERNVVSWTSMIAGFAQNEHFDEAMEFFQEMQVAGVKPNAKTFASVLPACANLGALHEGKEIHKDIIRSGFQSNVFLGSALVDMYAKCGRIEDARMVFAQIPRRDEVLWNAMIVGYAQNGHVNEALKIFQKMPGRNLVSWNAMIVGYVHNGHFDDALNLFRQLKLTGVKSNSDIFASVLSACTNLAALHAGKELHEDIIRSGCQSNVFVGSALVDMYAKCGSIEEACVVFDRIPERNVVSWNAMIAGFAQNGHVDEALKIFKKMPAQNVISWTTMIGGYTQNGHFDEAWELFSQMRLTDVKPNAETFATVLPACAGLAALDEGKEVHRDIIRSGFQSDIFVQNGLVDMYAKCGGIDDARAVFEKMLSRNVISWTAMIVGYAMHGFGKEALHTFRKMQLSSTKPDHVTFVGVLFACCHAGLVNDGWQYFNCMSRDYHITPTIEHYCCMVDLLGRAGHLDKAQDFIREMPVKPDAAVWGSLLGACRIHTNIELGEYAAEHLFELDPKNAAHYVVLSNIYAAAGRWDDVEKVRKTMKDRRVKKMPGCSWIEVNNKLNAFLVGETEHIYKHRKFKHRWKDCLRDDQALVMCST
eukprot:Gb_09455 [translate_table: standard]